MWVVERAVWMVAMKALMTVALRVETTEVEMVAEKVASWEEMKAASSAETKVVKMAAMRAYQSAEMKA